MGLAEARVAAMEATGDDQGEHAAAHPGVHVWMDVEPPCCAICGKVRRRDGNNKPCRGVARIALRGDYLGHQRAELLALEDGWYNGEGVAPLSGRALKLPDLFDMLDKVAAAGYPPFSACPGVDGEVVAEWETNGTSIILVAGDEDDARDGYDYCLMLVSGAKPWDFKFTHDERAAERVLRALRGEM